MHSTHTMSLTCFCFKTQERCLDTPPVKGMGPLNNTVNEQRRMPALGTLRLVFLFSRMSQIRVNRWVYSFWRLCFNITNKIVRVRNKIRDRYYFMWSCSREMVFLSEWPILVRSKIFRPLTDSLLIFWLMLVYPVKEFLKIGYFLEHW